MKSAVPITQVVSLEEAYRAAHDDAVLVDRSNLGMLKFTGESRLDLVNRMSTQKVDSLASGEGAATVLCTDIGRILDRLVLYTSSESVYCLTGEDNGQNIANYLRRFVFFMDDFQTEDLSDETTIIGVYGQRVCSRLSPLFGDSVDIPLHHWRKVELAGLTCYLHRSDPVAGDGYLVMAQSKDGPQLWERLVETGLTPAGEDAFEYLRIESGQPRFGRELTEEYIPLETGLWDDVSFNKGCYTGQEIIARMESRGRLAKKLVLLRPEKTVEVGLELTAGGRKVGIITSAADGPAGPVALGYVKTSTLDEAIDLTAGDVQLTVTAGEV